MAYSTSNPPQLLVCSFDGTSPGMWTYSSTDTASAVDLDGYISDGQDLGMRVGDLVMVTDTDASPVIVTMHRVASLSAVNRSVDLTDGNTLVTGTDSD